MRRRGFLETCLFVTCVLVLGGMAVTPSHGAVWTVTSAADQGEAGTLRSAVNRAAPGDVVVFSKNDFRIVLNESLTIDKNLTLLGPCTLARKEGTDITLLTVLPGGDGSLSDVKFDGEDVSGGPGVNNGGTLTLVRCAVERHQSDTAQAPIINTGTLVMTDCTVAENSLALCGGMMNWGDVTMRHCVFRNNANRERSGFGGALYNFGTISMGDCTVTGNRAQGAGGGIYNALGTLSMLRCTVSDNTTSGGGGGIANFTPLGRVILIDCVLQDNSAKFAGGLGCAIRNNNILMGCTVTDNTPDQISGPYISDGSNLVGSAPNRQATALSGYRGSVAPSPRSTAADADVLRVSLDLESSESALTQRLAEALSSDLGQSPGGTPGSVNARIYYANTFENVALTSQDLAVEYTASWPERVRYYALFARADTSEYEMPPRGIQFEILPGQPLPAGVIPPEFYEDGEGLMTWRHTVTDNGSFDLNPQAGAVTFRVCAVRVAEVTPTPENGGGGGGCRGGFDGGFSPLGWALLAPLGALLRRR